MTLRQYIFTMALATVLCWFAWAFVLMNVDPFQTVGTGFIFFYMSIFLALLGTISIIIFFCYYWFDHDEPPLFRYVQMSFRQSFIVSLGITTLLYLQGKEWLSVTTGILIITFFVLLLSLTFSFRRITL